jgi:hypothetical protein
VSNIGRRYGVAPDVELFVGDFPAIAQQCGLTHRRNVRTFVSKVMVFDKPAS